MESNKLEIKETNIHAILEPRELYITDHMYRKMKLYHEFKEYFYKLVDLLYYIINNFY
jgi:hypothetical protein